MDFIREEKDGRVILKINGSVSVYEGAVLRDELLACFEQHEGVLLDLTGVDNFDTAGIQLLWSSRLTARNEGKTFGVLEASDKVMSLLTRAGMNIEEVMAQQH